MHIPFLDSHHQSQRRTPRSKCWTKTATSRPLHPHGERWFWSWWHSRKLGNKSRNLVSNPSTCQQSRYEKQIMHLPHSSFHYFWVLGSVMVSVLYLQHSIPLSFLVKGKYLQCGNPHIKRLHRQRYSIVCKNKSPICWTPSYTLWERAKRLPTSRPEWISISTRNGCE